ncbi:MAG: nicotinate-nucleotide adenylyltransferase [Enterobacteriaceae bacterium]
MADDKSPGSKKLYALFGGTFDPIHYGHIKPVEALAAEVDLQHVLLLPNHVPPHRPQPEASPAQRLQMLQLVVAQHPLFSIDQRELRRTTPSYTIDTLQELRSELGRETPLAFIIGQDSLLTLHLWHRWQELLDYCHLLVCARPGYPNELQTTELRQWLAQHRTMIPEQLKLQPQGLIYLARTPLLDISATTIRQYQRLGQSCNDLLPPVIQSYIRQQGLYH